MCTVYSYLEEHLKKSHAELNAYEHQFLIHLETLAPVEHSQKEYFFKELFNGAYVFIPDNGQTYQAFCAHSPDDLTNRDNSSSHFSIDTQYSFQGNLVKECLFGTKTVGEETGTWFQLESHNTNYTQLPGHLYSYLFYLATGKNQGPYGTSVHTEKNPLALDLTEPQKITLSPAQESNVVEHIGANLNEEDQIKLDEVLSDFMITPEDLFKDFDATLIISRPAELHNETEVVSEPLTAPMLVSIEQQPEIIAVNPILI